MSAEIGALVQKDEKIRLWQDFYFLFFSVFSFPK